MRNDIIFSVVVSLYNKEAYIEKTIYSILEQTYADFEIIVVDDGSTDNSCSVVKRIGDSRIHLVSKKNEGVSAARNYGISLAKYPYVAFIDGDDWWNPLFLEKMSALIQKYPEVAMYASSFAEVYGEKTYPVITYNQLSVGEQILDYIGIYVENLISPINSSSIVIKKKILSSHCFNEKLCTGEDLLLWLQIASKYQIAYINEILSYYNRNVSTSISRTLIPIHKNFMLYVKDIIIDPSEKLEYLIDSLIVRMLRPYYLFDISINEVNSILSSVDLHKQGIFYRLFYKLPKPLIRFLYVNIKKYYKA